MYKLDKCSVENGLIFLVWPYFVQERESATKKKKRPSKKQRRPSGNDAQPHENINGRRDDSVHNLDAVDGTSPISRHQDSVPSDPLDSRGDEDDCRITGSLPPISPRNSNHSAHHLDSDRPTESYRRLTEDELSSRLTDRQLPDEPNGSAFLGPTGSGAGKLAPIGQLEPLNTG